MAEREYDVLIVGARVAGATLAALLGDAGYRVLVVDRAAFPSATPSTHYFSGERGGAALARLGVLDDALALGCPPLPYRYDYVDDDQRGARRPTLRPGALGYALSVRRGPLDHLLARRARDTGGVTLLERTRLLGLLREKDRVVGARLGTPAGERAIGAGLVVGADGRHSAVARAVGATEEAGEAGHRAVYYRYASGFRGPGGRTPDGAEFSRLGDEMAYVFPSDGAVACVALSVNRPTFLRLRQRPEAGFAERLRAHRGLAARLAGVAWEGPLLGCGPERNYARVPAGPGWALVGDAGMHQDPWSGQGIDKAAVHAALLAEALIAARAGDRPDGEALARYRAGRDADGLPGYERTVALSRDLRQLAG